MSKIFLVQVSGTTLSLDNQVIMLAQGAAFDLSGDIALNTAHRTGDGSDHADVEANTLKLSGIEDGAEVNNISDGDAGDLTDGGETVLHSHPGGGGGNSRQAHGDISVTEEFNATTATDHTASVAASMDFTFAGFTEENPRTSILADISDSITIISESNWPISEDSLQTLDSMPEGLYEIKATSYDDGVAGFLDVSLIQATISGSLTEPINTDSNIDVLFSELIDPATVTNVGDGSGSFEVHNDTTPGWVAGALSTADNLTFTFNPTSDLTGGDSYTVHLATSILGLSIGTPYSGEDFTFTAVAVPKRSNASIYDDDCSDLTGWTDSDSVGSATTQETFGPESTFKQVSNPVPNSGEQAFILRDVGSVGARTVFSVDIYPVTLGARADNDRTSIGVYNGSDVLWLNFSNDNVQYIGSAGSWVDTGIPVATGEWQEFTADVTWATGAVDFYKAGLLVHQVASGGVWTAAEPDGTTKLLTTGYATGSITNYWNFVKIGSDLVDI